MTYSTLLVNVVCEWLLDLCFHLENLQVANIYTHTMNGSGVGFDIIDRLLNFGLDHVVDEILMMLSISDIGRFAHVNR